MSDFEIKVIDARPPRDQDGLLRRALRGIGAGIHAVLLQPRGLILLALGGGVVLFGTPHVGFEYECRHRMHGPGSCRAVAWCAYYGVQGRRVEFPREGESCRIITMLPLDWDAIIAKL